MKPFLKWAGGKFRVIPKIQYVLPKGKRLVEPFVGSGAVFMNTEYEHYLLGDSNPDLINLFLQLQKEGESFIDFAASFFSAETTTEDSFYSLREQFNSTDDIRHKSALFVYLNKHCFNGLCRYNSKGGFNVPYGKRTEPSFPRDEMLAFLEKAKRAEFVISDFVSTMEQAEIGDVVYCDPPYAPLVQKSNFTSYSVGNFGMIEQLKLVEMALELQSRGIPVVISNHNTEFTQEAYQKAELHEFDVQRNIAADGANRIKAKELLAVFR